MSRVSMSRVSACIVMALDLWARSLVAQAQPVQSIQANTAQSHDYSVQVTSAVPVLWGKNQPALSIAYQYEFRGRDGVEIVGLGVVPSKGLFRYVTFDKQLEFRDTGTGRTLLIVPLKETIIVAAQPPQLDAPDVPDFPKEYLKGQWKYKDSFEERATAVLGNYFHYRCYEDNKIFYLTTTFAPLKLPQNDLLGQIAVFISFPFNSSSDNYDFRVYSFVREGRPLSDAYRSASNETILAAAKEFVNSLIAQLQVEAKQ